jgi:hypothetical protein
MAVVQRGVSESVRSNLNAQQRVLPDDEADEVERQRRDQVQHEPRVQVLPPEGLRRRDSSKF